MCSCNFNWSCAGIIHLIERMRGYWTRTYKKAATFNIRNTLSPVFVAVASFILSNPYYSSYSTTPEPCIASKWQPQRLPILPFKIRLLLQLLAESKRCWITQNTMRHRLVHFATKIPFGRRRRKILLRSRRQTWQGGRRSHQLERQPGSETIPLLQMQFCHHHHPKKRWIATNCCCSCSNKMWPKISRRSSERLYRRTLSESWLWYEYDSNRRMRKARLVHVHIITVLIIGCNINCNIIYVL